jgi:hypothetical protein
LGEKPHLKILFLTNGDLPDFMADTICHGGRLTLGGDFVDFPRCSYLYTDYGDVSGFHGRGFSHCKLLDPTLAVDRDDIVNKLKNKFFDIVIFGSIQRNQLYFGGITSVYPRNKIAAVDGEDSPYTFPLHDKVLMFKRELCSQIDGFWPIHFGIPAHKILPSMPEKTRFMSAYDPLINQSTVYDNEKDYLAGYACSYFAPTMRRMGHDCMRHVEILSQWAIPYHRAIDGTPDLVMHRYPKREVDMVRRLIEYSPTEGKDTAIDFYNRVIEKVMKHARENLTTESVFKYLVDTVFAQK